MPSVAIFWVARVLYPMERLSWLRVPGEKIRNALLQQKLGDRVVKALGDRTCKAGVTLDIDGCRLPQMAVMNAASETEHTSILLCAG